jgi:hypothetical protein
MKHISERDAFGDLMRKLLRVPHSDLKAKLEKEKEEKKRKKRKIKSSSASHALGEGV